MKNSVTNFEEALTASYIENPCGIQANTLWKTLKWLKDFNGDYSIKDGDVEKLEIWNDSTRLLYWHKDSNKISFSRDYFEGLDFLLIHENYFHGIPKDVFTYKTPYFRLIHRGKTARPLVPEGFEVDDVDIDNQLELVSKFIGDCYDDIKPSVEDVKEWISHPVFDKNLWVWIIDKQKGIPAGLGIAEFDGSIKEGSLEWIQLLPQYRGRGIGQMIVLELLYRLNEKAEFTTVAGRVDNKTNPEGLYRKCGFIGTDVWWAMGR